MLTFSLTSASLARFSRFLACEVFNFSIFALISVTLGAFYHHFKNKKQLLSACYKQQLIMIDAYITTKTDLTNGWSALESIFEHYLDYIIDNNKNLLDS